MSAQQAVTGRIQAELELLRRYFKNVDCVQEQNRLYIVISNYPLPAGWNRPSIDLAIVIPPGYPVTPPDNFYVRPQLRLSSTSTPGNYNDDASGQGMPGWSWFSFHMQDVDGRSTWNSSSELLISDNLLTYVRAINDRLREAN